MDKPDPAPDLRFPWTVNLQSWDVMDADGNEVVHVSSSLDDVEAAEALRIIAAAPETAERLRELVEAADNVTASLHGCITTEPMEQALFALRAAVARARGGE